MTSHNATASYCLWMVGIVAVLAAVYLLCGMGKGGCAQSGASCSGKAAQRAAPRPPSLRGGRSQTKVPGKRQADATQSAMGGLTPIGTYLMPAEEDARDVVLEDALEGAGCDTRGADMAQYQPKSASIAGNAKGANVRAHQMSESGRSDGTKAGTVGLSTVPWLKPIDIPLTGICVSFNDSDVRQTTFMKHTQCHEHGTCPFGPDEKHA